MMIASLLTQDISHIFMMGHHVLGIIYIINYNTHMRYRTCVWRMHLIVKLPIIYRVSHLDLYRVVYPVLIELNKLIFLMAHSAKNIYLYIGSVNIKNVFFF